MNLEDLIKDLHDANTQSQQRIEQEKENKQLTIENEVLKTNLRDVANQLRGGVSKIQQKTMARVIEECFGEKK